MITGFVWIALLICVGILSDRYKRSVVGYLLLSLLITPILTLVLLWALGIYVSHEDRPY